MVLGTPSLLYINRRNQNKVKLTLNNLYYSSIENVITDTNIGRISTTAGPYKDSLGRIG